MASILKQPTSECNCTICRAMCKRPCWPTPDEAQAIINAGYGDWLMLDWYEPEPSHGIYETIYILCPASKHHESQNAPDDPVQGCTFFNDRWLCDLHNLGLKPLEGRLAHHTRPTGSGLRTHRAIAKLWNTPEAQEMARIWEVNHVEYGD